jgi:flagellar capping protein FliD
MTATQQITGLSSGFDTATIVEKLMAVEKVPYTKLDTQKQTEELKLQAYQAINSMLLGFKNSVASVSSSKLWNSKAAVSTNDSSLSVTANEYAVNGSYSLRVAQLATSAQFNSKGFASSKTSFVKQNDSDVAYKIGTLTFNKAEVRVDNSAKLDQMNGGRGVFRGSVRVTDASGATSIIDLSTCDTMDDVVRTLNGSTAAQITASIQDGKLQVSDNSGGSGSLKVQNVGSGTTATDLGIAGTGNLDGGKTLLGRNVYVMGNDTALSLLQDGLGVEEGTFYLRVTNGAQYYDVGINVDDCFTVGEVIARVNNELEYRVANRINDSSSGGGFELLENLRFGLNDDKNAFALTGTKAGSTYQFYENPDTNLVAVQEPASQLGLLGRKLVAVDNETVEFARVMGGVDSPMIKNLSGVDGYGLGSAGNSALISVPFSAGTKISALNSGTGVDGSMPLQIRLAEGGADVSNSASLVRTFYNILDSGQLNSMLSDDNATIGDLVSFINKGLAEFAADPANNAAGLAGLRVDIDQNNARLVMSGAQAGYKIEMVGTLANSLGLFRGDTAGTAMELDDPAKQAELQAFYDSAALISSGEIKAGDTLADLAAATGVADADLINYITEKLTGVPGTSDGLKLTVGGDYLDPATGNLYELDPDSVAVDLDFSSLFSTFDSNTTIGDLLDGINGVITAQVHDAVYAAAQAKYGSGIADFQVSSPQLRINTLANGFQWSNLDFSKSFRAEGDFADALGIAKSLNTGQAGGLELGTLPPDTLGGFNFSPKTSAYVVEKTLDGNTQLSELNYGAGLTFAGDEADTLDIDLGSGGSISITMKELREAVNAASSLNTTLDSYAAILNGLVADKLTASGSSAALSFQMGSQGLEITGIAGADKLVISGPVAEAVKTGISAVNFTTDPVGETIPLAELKAGEIVLGTISGLGDIKLKLGGSELTLSTSGLSGDSTLNELVSRLNQELRSQGVNDVVFGLNDAGTGIAVDNNSGQKLEVVNTRDVNTLARDLGLIDQDGNGIAVESYSHYNSAGLGRKYLSRATSLASYLGSGVVPGSIVVTNAKGNSRTIDLAEAKTVGDVLDAINSDAEFGVQAMINERGDGITLLEAYPTWAVPDSTPTGNISVSDYDDGTLAKKLGLAGQGSRDNAIGASIFEGSLRTVIDVMSSDTLESLMYRISEEGYKTAIVNDGSLAAPYRLTVSSSNTGEASDFVMESDLDIFGFNQSSRAKDAKVLYGDPASGAAPMLLSSSTNSNSTAILGLTLDIKAVSDQYANVTVSTDKEKAVEAIKELVQTYNDLNDLVSYLDSYDSETNEPGVLFGDSNIRKLMEDINDMFYLVFNPDQQKIGSVDENGKLRTWTWMDMGISLSAKNSNSDNSGTWYSSMDLNLDTLDEMVANNWEILAEMLAGQRNASNSKLNDSVKAVASFNGGAAEGFNADNAINGDTSKGSWGVNNGFMAEGTIAQGENEYTIFFQQPTTISRMSVFHYDTATALKNYTIEYLDANSGKWETFREVDTNTVEANYFGTAIPLAVNAIRITASSTNAEDGKFRLLDVQVFEDIGLAGKLNQLTTTLSDSQIGFMAERNTEITEKVADIEERMAKLQERLDLKEQSLWNRFTAMETALGQLQNQSSYFTSMMDSMSTGK